MVRTRKILSSEVLLSFDGDCESGVPSGLGFMSLDGDNKSSVPGELGQKL